jgi:hypothetical protein
MQRRSAETNNNLDLIAIALPFNGQHENKICDLFGHYFRAGD